MLFSSLSSANDAAKPLLCQLGVQFYFTYRVNKSRRPACPKRISGIVVFNFIIHKFVNYPCTSNPEMHCDSSRRSAYSGSFIWRRRILLVRTIGRGWALMRATNRIFGWEGRIQLDPSDDTKWFIFVVWVNWFTWFDSSTHWFNPSRFPHVIYLYFAYCIKVYYLSPQTHSALINERLTVI